MNKEGQGGRRGFSLIELLVVVSITGILVTFGYANYRNFSRRKALEGTVRQVEGDLRMAQRLALSGEGGNQNVCDAGFVIKGYKFIMESENSYSIKAWCVDLSDSTIESIEDVGRTGINLNPRVEFSVNPNEFTFKSVNGGLSLPSPFEEVSIFFNTPDLSNYFILKISATGEINYKEYTP